jgi:MSHA biogenesis protein MshL
VHKHPRHSFIGRSAALLLLMLSGCGSDHWEIPQARKVFSREPQIPEVPAPDETVRGEDDPSIVTLKIGKTLKHRPLGRADALPSTIIVPTTNLQNVPVTAALEAVLGGTDISLAYQPESFNDRTVTLLNLSGPLPSVVGRICSAARIFCIAREGNLELKEKESFVIELPPIERAVSVSSTTVGGSGSGGSSSSGATNTIVDAISQLAGSKASADNAGGNLIYTTDVEGQERVSKYLEQLRNGRPLIVLQMYIWEVSLEGRSASGINWQNLTTGRFGSAAQDIAFNSGSAFSALTGGVSMGAVLSGKVSATVIANFLSTQGVVQTLSNPQLTFVSGSSAEFRVGGTRSYVASVGQLTSSTTQTPGNAAGIGTNTVSTSEIETGLKIGVNGSYESGVIFTTLAIALTDLIRIEPITTGSTTLQLPETTNRDFNTVLRMRPGDSIVLAGMTSSRDDLSRNRLNLPVLDSLPLRSDDQTQNRELVVLIKPAIIFFSDADPEPQAPAAIPAAAPQARPVVPARAPVPAMQPAVQVAPPMPLQTPSVNRNALQSEMSRLLQPNAARGRSQP